ncbi:hypothetical protein DFH11DRAFT_1878392 [Phellopilus nigrolimitatus]|nr:hypothetical protein DFH11DRAFT_1878392 [Phellopilus nigrolimitatus]
MAPQQYVPASGDGSETHAPAASQAPLESSTNIRTKKRRSCMGKVELAYHDLTGEKILPRSIIASPGMNGVAPTAKAAAKQASKEASKETRTMREARCRRYYTPVYLRSTAERVARTFSRQIGSALNYCHRNNVFHCDLKIENSLISQTDNMKIIDFCLSSIYSRVGHLSTFCGSLYFAAPELLNAKVFTEPQVDIRSFGVVLYVLVCGKLPFDNQSMPALHAEIERGLVECPDWLSAAPAHTHARRQTIHAHMLHREPLRADELDRRVIRGMSGFDFGSEDEIERKLVDVLRSDACARAFQPRERRRQAPGRNGHGELSNASLACYESVLSAELTETLSKKIFLIQLGPARHPMHRTPGTSSWHLSHASLIDMQCESADPTGGFHPLLSIYFLAREKLENERVYRPGHFTSSQMLLLGRDDRCAPSPSAMELLPACATIKTNGRSPQSDRVKADYGMALLRLPVPTSTHWRECRTCAVPSPTSPNFAAATSAAATPHPRARDAGTEADATNDIPSAGSAGVRS